MVIVKIRRGQLSLRFFFFFQAEDGIRDYKVTGVQTCALPIPARLANGLGDALGDIATIETVPPGINCGFAPALPVPLLGLAERAQGAPEIVLADRKSVV